MLCISWCMLEHLKSNHIYSGTVWVGHILFVLLMAVLRWLVAQMRVGHFQGLIVLQSKVLEHRLVTGRTHGKVLVSLAQLRVDVWVLQLVLGSISIVLRNGSCKTLLRGWGINEPARGHFVFSVLAVSICRSILLKSCNELVLWPSFAASLFKLEVSSPWWLGGSLTANNRILALNICYEIGICFLQIVSFSLKTTTSAWWVTSFALRVVYLLVVPSRGILVIVCRGVVRWITTFHIIFNTFVRSSLKCESLGWLTRCWWYL